MADSNQINGVAGLKKYDVKVSGIVFMIYCLVGAGAFGIAEMIPVLPCEGGVYVWVP